MKIDIIIIALATVFFQFLPANGAAELNYDEIQVLFSEDRLDEAEAILKNEARTNHKNPVALALLGELYRKKGDRDNAFKYLNRAISLNPDYPMAYFYRAQTFFSAQKLDEAAEDFEFFMKKMRSLARLSEEKSFYISRLHDISHMYFSFKRYEDAKKVIDEVLGLDPKDQSAIYNTGIYYYMYERNRPTAYKYFSKTVEIDPSTRIADRARYAIEFMRTNPDSRVEPNFDFVDRDR